MAAMDVNINLQKWLFRRLSVVGAMQVAQCKWRNGENNRTLTLTQILALTLTLFLTLNLTPNDYFRHCTICIAPNTHSHSK